jgi:hypothetical protein|tara:strand:+ start:262 stop:747 length:486 start_codon:yes stop_codon:yes gene_type:complete
MKNKKNMETKIKKEEVVNNSNQPYGIKTPTTIEEFRENLKKYYWNMGGKGLYVRENDLPIKYDNLNSLSDLYDVIDNSWIFNPPSICPKMELVKDVTEYMNETNQDMSCYGLFDNEEHFELVENQLEQKNPQWVKIDNQIYREFFYLTLGKFSGYEKTIKN